MVALKPSGKQIPLRWFFEDMCVTEKDIWRDENVRAIAVQDILLESNFMISIKSVYSETERQSVKIEVQEESLDV